MKLEIIRCIGRLSFQTSYWWIFLLFLTSCSALPRYDSRDLANLPCEPSRDRFFYPLEFQADGSQRFPFQMDDIRNALESGPAPTDVFVFIHGWDKRAVTAERDYQDLMCRLHREFLRSPGFENASAAIIGIFWPSTFFPNSDDPFVLKPFTYRVIRDRAGVVARQGFGPALVKALASLGANRIPGTRFHFVGHSFGGLILLEALTGYLGTSRGYDWLATSYSVNFVLLLPAVSAARFAVTIYPEDILYPESRRSMLGLDRLRVFLVYSRNDLVNRVAFWMTEGTCAVGGCGDDAYRELLIDTGSLCVDQSRGRRPWSPDVPANVWNVDASEMIGGHSDIYKGRVAALLWRLMRAGSVAGESLSLVCSTPAGGGGG